MIGASSLSPGLFPSDASSVIDVSFGLDGLGTKDQPWLLDEQHLRNCASRLNWTTRTLFFRPGIYSCAAPIRLDFGALFPTETGREMLREGVAIRGVARASTLIFPTLRGLTGPAFQVWWSRTGLAPGAQVPLFFWEFTGLNVKGNVDHELVRFGGADIEETPFNSCVFQVCVNNGYVPDGDPTEVETATATGPGRGIHFLRLLESSIDIVATCAMGMAAVFDTCEFCTIKGSFSNAECDVRTIAEGGRNSHTGKAIRPLSHGAYMLDCCCITGLSINLEVCYTGITMERGCRGMAFANVISNNCDVRGSIFNVREVNDDAVNKVECVVRRQCIQGGEQLQEVFDGTASRKITMSHLLS